MGAPSATQDFKLVEGITEDDLAAMTAIGQEAFRHDPHTNLKTYLLPEESKIIDTGIRDWIPASAGGRCHVIKAVHTTTSEIMGFICWVHRGYIPRPPQPEAVKGRTTELTEDEDDAGGDEQQTKKKKTRIQIMEDMEDQHFTDFMTDIMPEGTKCWFIGGLNVAPQFQRMGVARALLGWGTARAERDGVFAWVHSSESAWRAYSACGFEVVRVLRTDLDAYAEGDAVGKGPGEGGKWGIYTVRYMVYKPERIGSTGWKVIENVEDIPIS